MAFDDDERQFFESVEGPLSALLSAAVHAVATQRVADPKASLLQFVTKAARTNHTPTSGTLLMSKDDEIFFETVRSQVEALIGEAVHEIVTKRVTNFEAHLCEFFRKAVEGPTTLAPSRTGSSPTSARAAEAARLEAQMTAMMASDDAAADVETAPAPAPAVARAAPPGMAPPQHQMTAEQEAEEFGC